ncbi:LOW QUALITY PROTEIN: hypothetical protein QYF61_003024 [Mycteria americana]|uniref:Uncharacterized protein n=1 Tax=Mycteria americana TaxID=33587 RepID=A0AAN7MT28_MYCAM|nr:LOW QUALITY PROTEIN: hypothetical protein QYF61_003024 [Mycteria americana]
MVGLDDLKEKGRERKRREGKGREGKGREGKGREGKGREGKGREGKGREGKGREGKGREGKGEERRGEERRGEEKRGEERRGEERRGEERRGEERRGEERRGEERESPLGGSPEGQRSPGRLDILQEGNLKGTRAGCPHVPKDEPAGKKTSLAEQRTLAGIQGKTKRVYDLWKKGQATQKDYKDVVRLCREKIKRPKARLELNLATATIKPIYNYISNKGWAKENLHPLQDARGNIVTKAEEKAEILNAFFASVFK